MLIFSGPVYWIPAIKECLDQLRPVSASLCQCSTLTQFMFHVKNTRLIRDLDWVNGQHVAFAGLSLLSAANRVWLDPGFRLIRYCMPKSLEFATFWLSQPSSRGFW